MSFRVSVTPSPTIVSPAPDHHRPRARRDDRERGQEHPGGDTEAAAHRNFTMTSLRTRASTCARVPPAGASTSSQPVPQHRDVSATSLRGAPAPAPPSCAPARMFVCSARSGQHHRAASLARPCERSRPMSSLERSPQAPRLRAFTDQSALAQQAGVVVALDRDGVAGAEGLPRPALRWPRSVAWPMDVSPQLARTPAGGSIVRHGHGPHRDGDHLHLVARLQRVVAGDVGRLEARGGVRAPAPIRRTPQRRKGRAPRAWSFCSCEMSTPASDRSTPADRGARPSRGRRPGVDQDAVPCASTDVVYPELPGPSTRKRRAPTLLLMSARTPASARFPCRRAGVQRSPA